MREDHYGKIRPQLEKLLETLQSGDTPVVWKPDRPGRSIHHLINMIDGFNAQGINFISLQENINTQSVQGRFFLSSDGLIGANRILKRRNN